MNYHTNASLKDIIEVEQGYEATPFTATHYGDAPFTTGKASKFATWDNKGARVTDHKSAPMKRTELRPAKSITHFADSIDWKPIGQRFFAIKAFVAATHVSTNKEK